MNRIGDEISKAFIADRGYDAVDIIQKILDKGLKPAIKMKETMRMSIKHSWNVGRSLEGRGIA
jgi:hypothetical protein